MRKRFFVLSFLFVHIIFCCCAQASSQEWIAEYDAKKLAQQYLRNQRTMSEEDYKTYYFSEAIRSETNQGEPAWAIMFKGNMDDPRYATNVYVIYVNAYSGELAYVDPPTVPNPFTSMFNRYLSERPGGSWIVFWTIEEKYAFKQAITEMYENYLKIESEENYLPVGDYQIKVLQYDYRLPDEHCITMNDATLLANEELKKTASLTDSDLVNNYTNAYSFLYSDHFSAKGRLVWKVFYIPIHQPQDGDYGYFVEIDAYTGEVVGIEHQIQTVDNMWAYRYE